MTLRQNADPKGSAYVSGPACIGAVILALAFGQSFSAQQTRDTRPTAPAAAKPPAPSGTGALAGVVTVADGSQPVKFAYVVLIGTVTGLVKVTSTDADGRFAFGNLPVDRFTVGASKLPYLGSVAGARRPGRPGTPIALAAGQKISTVAIRMPMGGAITGVITDEKGLPSMSTTVMLQQWKMQNGQRTLVQAPGSGNAFTDDRGRYRFYGLQPGDYVVAAVRQSAPINARALTAADVDSALAGRVAEPPTPTGPPVRYAPVFFPGTVREADAIPITLTVGEERQNVDVRLELVPLSRVEGQVLLSDGQPAQSMVMIQPSGLQVATMAVGTGPDGRFSFTNSPGKYTLTARGNGPTAGQFASAVVEVSVGNMPGVQLTMRPGITLTGQLVFEGRQNPAISGRRVPVRQLANLAAPTVSATTATGEFNLSNVIPGMYVIGGPLSFGPTTDTMTWALQSVVADGRDVTDLPLEITTDTPPKSIVVTYSDRFQELSGRLQSQSGAAVSDYTILVFPEDKAYWIQGSRRIVTARPGTDGRFTLSGQGPTTLPPGRYLLAAVTDIGKDEQFDPAFLAQIVPAGIPITLSPGEKKVQDLAIK